MDSRQLQLVLKLQDQATKELRRISGDINKAEKSTMNWGAALKTAAKGLAIFSAAAGTVGFVTVKAAAEAEGAWNKFNTVFGENAGDMTKFVDELRKEMPTARDQIVRMAADLQDLLVPLGLTRDKATDLSKGFLDAANKIAAFNDVDPTQVLEAMKSALAGSSEPLRRYGINALETSLEARAMKDGLLDAGQAFKDLDPEVKNQIRAQALLAQVIDNSSDAINGFQENQDSFIRRQQELKATFSDLTVEIGNHFLPVADNMLKAILPFVKDTLPQWIEALQNTKQNTSDLFDLIDQKTGLVTYFTEAWKSVVMVYNEQLAPALAGLWESLKPLQPLLDAMVVVFGTSLVIAIKVAGDIILGLILVLTQLFTWTAKLNTFWAGVWVKTIDLIGTAIVKVTDFVENFIEKLRTAINLAKELGGGTLGFVKGLLPGRADGGPVSGGSAYMVGERGPELFVPRTSGSIVPNHSLGGSAGGVNITINGDVSGQELVDRVLEAIEGDIKRRVRVTA